MAQGRNQFVGASGQFYLAYGLAAREINASITIGNAPSVDVYASSADGKTSMTFQVKTARNARLLRHYGSEGYEWDVGFGVIGKHSASFWYALVDLQASQQSFNPRVFFVPSLWVAQFVKPGFSRSLFFLPRKAEDDTLERWDRVRSYLNGEKEAIEWATTWPEEKLIRWGEQQVPNKASEVTLGSAADPEMPKG